MNYEREIPVRFVVLLKYIIRENNFSNLTPNKYLLYNYANNNILRRESFTIDAEELHTFIVKLIAQNEEAESTINIHKEEINRRKDWKSLKSYYEGMGVYSNDITKAEIYLKKLTYMGENKQTMWWVEFERSRILANQTYVNHERRLVHSDQMKLRSLLEKVTCDCLRKIKSSIKVRLSDRPMTYTFTQALQHFKT